MSDDARFVVFASPGFGAGDANAVFQKDRATGALTPISVDYASGATVEGRRPSISADGRYVAFDSLSRRLVAGDSNTTLDVFVRDTLAGVTTRVSIGSSGTQGNADSSHASISGDGRYVAYVSAASNLAANDINGSIQDVFVHDRVLGSVVLASRTAAGTSASGAAHLPRMARNGSMVVFAADDDLDGSSPVAEGGVFAYDLALNTTRRVSFDPLGAPARGVFWNTLGLGDAGSITPDARFVTYYLDGQLLRYDSATGAVISVSALVGGAELEGGVLSASGRHAAFTTFERLSADDVNDTRDVYLLDIATARVQRLSIELPGQLSNYFEMSANAQISPDGCTVVFESRSNYLVAGDTNSTTGADVFAYDAREQSPQLYCAAGTSSSGCVGSLTTAGDANSTSGSGFVITASGVDAQRTGMLLYSVSGRISTPLGQSLLCIAAPRQRTVLQASTGAPGTCSGALQLDWNGYVAANSGALGLPVVEITHVQAQVWMRDPSLATPLTLTNAVEFVVCP